jgi:hypothetical protein
MVMDLFGRWCSRKSDGDRLAYLTSTIEQLNPRRSGGSLNPQIVRMHYKVQLRNTT